MLLVAMVRKATVEVLSHSGDQFHAAEKVELFRAMNGHGPCGERWHRWKQPASHTEPRPLPTLGRELDSGVSGSSSTTKEPLHAQRKHLRRRLWLSNVLIGARLLFISEASSSFIRDCCAMCVMVSFGICVLPSKVGTSSSKSWILSTTRAATRMRSPCVYTQGLGG
jgi:hypothetical protein